MFLPKQLSLYLPQDIVFLMEHGWHKDAYGDTQNVSNPTGPTIQSFRQRNCKENEGRGCYRLQENEVIFQPILCMKLV